MKKFDYESISDVVLHVRYTALDGGPLLKRAAAESVVAMRQSAKDLGEREGFWRLLELRHKFSNEWLAFQAALGRKTVDRVATMDLRALASRLPPWAYETGQSSKVESLVVVIRGTADDDIAQDLVIPALGDKPWDVTTLGDKKLFAKRELEPEVSLEGDAAWTLKVSKKAGEVCAIEDISIMFRYILGKDASKKK